MRIRRRRGVAGARRRGHCVVSTVLCALGYEGRGGNTEEVVDCARAILQRAAGSGGARYRCRWTRELDVFEA